MIKLSNI